MKTHSDGHIVKGIINGLTRKAIALEPAPSTVLRSINNRDNSFGIKQQKEKKKRLMSYSLIHSSLSLITLICRLPGLWGGVSGKGYRAGVGQHRAWPAGRTSVHVQSTTCGPRAKSFFADPWYRVSG